MSKTSFNGANACVHQNMSTMSSKHRSDIFIINMCLIVCTAMNLYVVLFAFYRIYIVTINFLIMNVNVSSVLTQRLCITLLGQVWCSHTRVRGRAHECPGIRPSVAEGSNMHQTALRRFPHATKSCQIYHEPTIGTRDRSWSV